MRRGILTAAGAVVFIALAFTVDRLLTRPQRMDYDRRVRDLWSVHDALLLFEHELGALPETLGDLVPYYLRADELIEKDRPRITDEFREADGPRYSYDRAGRAVALAHGVPIGGLWRRTWPAPRLVLPPASPPQGPASLALAGNALTEPPAGTWVFEAEHYAEMNYGWEAHPDPACAGGAYLHCKEGIGNGPGQIHARVFNFYDVEEGQEYFRLIHHFHLPQAGTYEVYARFWTTGSHCSNAIIVGVDEGGPRPNGKGYFGRALSNNTPFRWVWTRVDGIRKYLEAGDHYLHIFIHEDGVRLDQIALSQVSLAGAETYRANLPQVVGTEFARRAPVLDLGLDLESMVLDTAQPPHCKVLLRRLAGGRGIARLVARLRGASQDGGDLTVLDRKIELAGLREVEFWPLDFSALDLERLQRREFLLEAEVRRGTELLAQRRVPLQRPCAWEVSGQLPYLSNDQPGPLDEVKPGEGDACRWRPFKLSSFDTFGVLDFGLETIGNSLHAPALATIYARTRIEVPESGRYLLKIQSDDQLLLWIDGQLACRRDEGAPVTRSAERLKLQLAKGVHEVRMRVNQAQYTSFGDGRWQASLRFRTLEDRVSGVVGLSASGNAR